MPTTTIIFDKDTINAWNLVRAHKDEIVVLFKRVARQLLQDQSFAFTGLDGAKQRKPRRIRIDVTHDGTLNDAQVTALFTDLVPVNPAFTEYPDDTQTEEIRFVSTYVDYRVTQESGEQDAEAELAAIEALREGPWTSWHSGNAQTGYNGLSAAQKRKFEIAIWAALKSMGQLGGV